MKPSLFQKILLGVVCIGLLITVIHLAYDMYAYQHSSILYFLAQELW